MSYTENSAPEKRDAHERVTSQIVNAIDQGVSNGQLGATAADLIPLPSPPSPAGTPSLEQVQEYIRASKAENTLRGYQSDWRHFCTWCESNRMGPLPATAETVAAYIAESAGSLKVGSPETTERDCRGA
jgi:hypothetical protein